MAGGAVVLPSSSYGGFGHVLSYLPSGALGTGMRAALLEPVFPIREIVILAAWAVLGTVLTARSFKWE
jgi:ABC-2 type transport system permease protein